MVLGTRSFTVVPVLFVALGGCGKSDRAGADAAAPVSTATAASAATSAPPASADVATDAAVAPAVPRYFAFVDKDKHHLAIERSGASLRAILDTGARLELVGKMTDATHFALRATKVAQGDKRTKLTGELGAGTLKATLVDAAGKAATATWTAGAALPPTFDGELLGRIGKAFVRMKLAAAAGALTGTYRYAASTSDLDLVGTVHDDGSFELTETAAGTKTGAFTGVLASPSAILGQWRSPDGARAAPFVAEHARTYPGTASFDEGVTLFPQEKLIEGRRCRIDLLFPQLRGGPDPKALKTLNDYLRGDGGKVKTCEGPGPDDPEMSDYETNESYGLDTHAGRFLGIHRDVWDYSGGAHGNFGSECIVIDAKTLQHFKLASKLTEAGRARLGAIVAARLAKEHEVEKLTDADYFADVVEITPDSDVCLRSDGLEVTFDPYEIGPYAIGPSAVRLTMPEARPLFVKDEVTRAIFGK